MIVSFIIYLLLLYLLLIIRLKKNWHADIPEFWKNYTVCEPLCVNQIFPTDQLGKSLPETKRQNKTISIPFSSTVVSLYNDPENAMKNWPL